MSTSSRAWIATRDLDFCFVLHLEHGHYDVAGDVLSGFVYGDYPVFDLDSLRLIFERGF